VSMLLLVASNLLWLQRLVAVDLRLWEFLLVFLGMLLGLFLRVFAGLCCSL